MAKERKPPDPARRRRRRKIVEAFDFPQAKTWTMEPVGIGNGFLIGLPPLLLGEHLIDSGQMEIDRALAESLPCDGERSIASKEFPIAYVLVWRSVAVGKRAIRYDWLIAPVDAKLIKVLRVIWTGEGIEAGEA